LETILDQKIVFLGRIQSPFLDKLFFNISLFRRSMNGSCYYSFDPKKYAYEVVS